MKKLNLFLDGLVIGMIGEYLYRVEISPIPVIILSILIIKMLIVFTIEIFGKNS